MSCDPRLQRQAASEFVPHRSHGRVDSKNGVPHIPIRRRKNRVVSRPKRQLHALLYLLLPGCQLPDIRYETEHVRVGTFFEHEVCEGSLLQIEDWATTTAEELGIDLPGKRTVYWGRDGVDEHCGSDRHGCYDL